MREIPCPTHKINSTSNSTYRQCDRGLSTGFIADRVSNGKKQAMKPPKIQDRVRPATPPPKTRRQPSVIRNAQIVTPHWIVAVSCPWQILVAVVILDVCLVPLQATRPLS